MFDFFKKQPAAENLEKEIYRVVTDELEKDEIDRVLWVKAFAESGGDRDKAKAIYIKCRVDELKVATSQTVSAMVNTEREKKRLEKEREKELKYRAKVAGAKYVKPKK